MFLTNSSFYAFVVAAAEGVGSYGTFSVTPRLGFDLINSTTLLVHSSPESIKGQCMIT